MFAPKSKSEKVKEIEGKLKTAGDIINKKEEDNKNIKQSLQNKKKALEEIKKQKNKKIKDVGADDAADFLKKYAKKKGKK